MKSYGQRNLKKRWCTDNTALFFLVRLLSWTFAGIALGCINTRSLVSFKVDYQPLSLIVHTCLKGISSRITAVFVVSYDLHQSLLNREQMASVRAEAFRYFGEAPVCRLLK